MPDMERVGGGGRLSTHTSAGAGRKGKPSKYLLTQQFPKMATASWKQKAEDKEQHDRKRSGRGHIALHVPAENKRKKRRGGRREGGRGVDRMGREGYVLLMGRDCSYTMVR